MHDYIYRTGFGADVLPAVGLWDRSNASEGSYATGYKQDSPFTRMRERSTISSLARLRERVGVRGSVDYKLIDERRKKIEQYERLLQQLS